MRIGNVLRSNLHYGIRDHAHVHILGRTQMGKSKLMEVMVRHNISTGVPTIVIDWKGTLVDNVFQWLACYGWNGPVILIDPSRSDFVTGINPFLSNGGDINSQATGIADATIKAWGGTDSFFTMPTVADVLRLLYAYCIESGEPLTNAIHLLGAQNAALRTKKLAGFQTDPQGWSALCLKTASNWDKEVSPIQRRLHGILASPIRNFLCLPTGNLDIQAVIDSGACVLVNLADRTNLTRTHASVFASFLLQQVFDNSMRRVARKHMDVFCDEAQNYLSETVASMLDQVLYSGTRLILAHHNLEQIENVRVRSSVLSNCATKVIFGGVSAETAKQMALAVDLTSITQKQIKDILMVERQRTVRAEETDTTTITGKTEDGEDVYQRITETTHMVNVPEDYTEFIDIEYTLPEKLINSARDFIYQEPRQCTVQHGGAKPEKVVVSYLHTPSITPAILSSYRQAIMMKQKAISASDAASILAQSTSRFLGQSNGTATTDNDDYNATPKARRGRKRSV